MFDIVLLYSRKERCGLDTVGGVRLSTGEEDMKGPVKIFRFFCLSLMIAICLVFVLQEAQYERDAYL
jgi:hypothetical protein